MSQAEDLLNISDTTGSQTDQIVYEIDPTTRVINIPSDFLLGVESDEKVNRVYFTCPKIVGDNIDLTALTLRVNYQNANGDKDYDSVEDVAETSDGSGIITFSWSLSREVTAYKGTVTFTICAVKKTGVEITNEWNTIPATGKVAEGLEVSKQDSNDITLLRGDTFSATLTIQDESGVSYIPDEGDNIVFIMKQNLSDEAVTLEKTIPTDTLKLSLASSDTKTLEVGNYIYCVKLTKTSGEVYTVIPESTLTLMQEVA